MLLHMFCIMCIKSYSSRCGSISNIISVCTTCFIFMFLLIKRHHLSLAELVRIVLDSPLPPHDGRWSSGQPTLCSMIMMVQFLSFSLHSFFEFGEYFLPGRITNNLLLYTSYFNVFITTLVWFVLVVFYDISTLVGYLMPNPVYTHTHTHTHTYIYIYIYIYNIDR